MLFIPVQPYSSADQELTHTSKNCNGLNFSYDVYYELPLQSEMDGTYGEYTEHNYTVRVEY